MNKCCFGIEIRHTPDDRRGREGQEGIINVLQVLTRAGSLAVQWDEGQFQENKHTSTYVNYYYLFKLFY